MADTPEPVIRVEGLSKVYRIWRSPGDRLLVPLFKRLQEQVPREFPRLAERIRRETAQRYREFTALDNVSFSLDRGDALGIVGPNGSGKSTLLQIISGLIQPSTGDIEVRGQVAALLELGSGFNPEFTGRENIYLNGAILGISKQVLRERLEEIIDFAELGEFIDQPIKTYSTGMVARLAFSVQVHVDPAILIVDETLSVGDAAFQAKAVTKIEEILNRRTTLLFVAHDMQMIRSFCNRAIYMNRGQVILDGDTEDVTRRYVFDAHQHRMKQQLRSAPDVTRTDLAIGTDDIRVIDASVDSDSRHVAVAFGQKMNFCFDIIVGADMRDPRVYIDILDGKGLLVAGRALTFPREYLHRAVTLRVTLKALLQRGIYRVRMRLADAPSPQRFSLRWRHDDMLSFEVTTDSRESFLGLFPLPIDAHWSSKEP